MITYKSSYQLTLDGSYAIQREVESREQMVNLSEIIPWDDFARIYYCQMSSRTGRPCKDARLALGPF